MRDIFKLTETTNIPHNYAKYHIYNKSIIARRILVHLASRFPECMWKVEYDNVSITVVLKSAPWAKNSEIIHAIADYAYYYANSYNYDYTNTKSDYCDVNFFGVYKNNIIAKDFLQRISTQKTKKIEENFMKQYYEKYEE